MDTEELGRGVPWGIPAIAGGIDAATAQKINEAERAAITGRRRHYGVPDADHAVGLALSGGGIRSATFSLGVLVALAARGVLPQVDYLSTVSGGGYLGSFVSAFLHSPGDKGIGLRADEFPFRREEGEAAALRHIRHHSKYLAVGTPWRRLAMIAAQLYGMVLNGLAVVYLAAVAVALELLLRHILPLEQTLRALTLVATAALGVGALGMLAALRFRRRLLPQADLVVAVLAVFLVVVLGLRGLEPAHAWFGRFDQLADADRSWSLGDKKTWLAVLGAIPVVTSALASALGQRLLRRAGLVLLVLSAVAAPLFFFGIYLAIYQWAASGGTLSVGGIEPSREAVLWGVVALGAALYLLLLDINLTSPHRHYRDQLARAYLVQAGADPADAASYASAVSLRLSAVGGAPHRAPYHLLNCALNVPGSKNPGMQGRLTDFFLFSPRYCGSPLIGYHTTESWEGADPHLDLATAMAISGAAAAPQMGLATVRRLSFWLVLLNVRLGYWLRKPDGSRSRFAAAPGLRYLLKEMRGTMDERLPWLNVSDGGHIENLGVYELLRRRCKYIIAVDGEQDPKMTFHALTTLQRLASIDLGVQIDLDLDDLRLNEKGLSRSHFRFARIRYPRDGRGSEDLYGYLLYVKLSLTGNEGEFIRRYRLDEPAFPHHSTADQFFSEAQFEAYRSLGEHVGDKLFLRAIVGDLADSKEVDVEEWFLRLGKCLLEPLSAAQSAGAR
jgi:hypothetical protein